MKEEWTGHVGQVLSGDEEKTWPKNNTLVASQLLPAYNALFRICFGNWIPTTNVTATLKNRAHLHYAFSNQKEKKFNFCTVMFKNILRLVD